MARIGAVVLNYRRPEGSAEAVATLREHPKRSTYP